MAARNPTTAAEAPPAPEAQAGTAAMITTSKGGKKEPKKSGGKSPAVALVPAAPDVRRLAADVEALRAEVAELSSALRSGAGATAAPATGGSELVFSRGGKSSDAAAALAALSSALRAAAPDAGAGAVALAYAYQPAGGAAEALDGAAALAAPLPAGASDDDTYDPAVARLAAAFAAPPKAALTRLLLAADAPQSAAALGIGAGLTTGSLYHHLREMAHAGVIAPSGKSRYALTSEGRFAALLLFALARRNGAA